MNNRLKFTQTLHGYNQGHTLLASSVDLPPEARRAMLNLSDMSGATMEQGFEEYLTGYALKDAHLYAIAKTWYAPEMPRPGCVWTHTLLINFSDLPRLKNLEFLLSLFKRPLINSDFEDYKRNLEIEDEFIGDDGYRPPLGNINVDIIKKILSSLYNNATDPIFITSRTPSFYDRLFLMIWRQQWPRLKRNFSFCTGAVDSRSINGIAMDLQVTPFNSNSFNRQKNNGVFIRPNEEAENCFEKWVEFAYEDLLRPSKDLQTFLNFFGSDLSIKRTSFKMLIQAFVFFSDETPKLTECIQFLANNFPSSTDAVNLKAAILGDGKSRFPYLPKYDETAVIFHLSTTSLFGSFNYLKLNFFQRFSEHFKELNDETVEILKQMILESPNNFGEEAIVNLAETSNGNKMHGIWKDRQLATVFIGINPRLTFNREFWLANVNNEQEILNQLQRTSIDGDGWERIAELLIDVDSKIDPELIAVNILNLEFIILDKINGDSFEKIGDNWLSFIKHNPASILEWMSQSDHFNIRTINILVQLLDPNSNQVIVNGASPWVVFLKSLTSAEVTNLPIEVHVFCLALAFNIATPDAQEIFKLTFEKVYFALANESVNYSLWRNLEVHTKPLSWLKDWDRCKKLINALVDYFIHNDLSIKKFLSGVYSPTLEERIIKQYKKRK